MNHCCFTGCTPLACGCCFYAFGHEHDCPENPSRQWEAIAGEITHEHDDDVEATP